MDTWIATEDGQVKSDKSGMRVRYTPRADEHIEVFDVVGHRVAEATYFRRGETGGYWSVRVKVRPPLVDEITFLVHDCNTNAMTLIVQALAAGFPTLDIDEETRW